MTVVKTEYLENQQVDGTNPPGGQYSSAAEKSVIPPRGVNPAARWEHWQRQLLDLSLRNRLLNTRDCQQMIPLTGVDLPLLEDALSDKDDFSLFPVTEMLTPAEAEILAQANYEIPVIREIAHDSVAVSADAAPSLATVAAKLRAQQTARRLCTPLSASELRKRQTAIYRQSRTDLEEGGANTLFIALGFLRWRDAEGKKYRAPILLMPLKLQRPSIRTQMIFRRLDEEIQLNVTLIEMLKREYKLTIAGLDPLPTDASGADVEKIFSVIADAVRGISGFEVEKQAYLGLFAFSKFIMWNDLSRRAEQLQNNPLVAHLVSGNGCYQDGKPVFPPEKIETAIKLEDLFCPLAADASQLTAVRYAALGKSFVLHGPPGTGKSQTITNIIADRLAHGRRVLFVSEKKAALDVVYRRLGKIGLQPFCLELHAHKGGKSEVVRQFSEALAFAETQTPAAWTETAHALENARSELRRYAEKLHHLYPNGLTPYRCFAETLAVGNSRRPAENYWEGDCLRQSASARENVMRQIREAVGAYQYVSPAARRIFAPLGAFPATAEKIAQVRDALAQTLDAARKLLTLARTVTAELFPDYAENAPFTLSAVRALCRIHAGLTGGEKLPAALLTLSESRETELARAIAAGREIAESAKTLGGYRLEMLADYDLDGIGERLRANAERLWPLNYFADRALVKELGAWRRPGAVPLDGKKLRADFPALVTARQAQATLGQATEILSAVFGAAGRENLADWEKLEALRERARFVRRAAGEWRNVFPENSRPAENEFWRAFVRRAENSVTGALAPEILAEAWDAFVTTAAESANVAQLGLRLGEAPVVDADDFEKPLIVSGDLENYVRWLTALQTRFAAEIRNVCLWKKLRETVADAGAAGLMRALETGAVAPENAPALGENAYYARMRAQILEAEPLLRDFMAPTQDARVRNFRELDARYTELSRQAAISEISARLSGGLGQKISQGLELGVLRHECEKKTRHKPVRQLLEQIPALATRLKPCFLMSPLSVAQYLPPGGIEFDLVIFDEASQIPVWDAIGVIARGAQLIVVGDQKQLPPTNFFQKGETDDAAGDAESDLESVLDECMAAGLPSAYLRWHYRSRHETLIAFSNAHYYGGMLNTFPAARAEEWLGVRHVPVENSPYQRHARTNRGEAAALVAHIVRRLQNPATAGKSMGIVTFSEAQKNLIEDLLETERLAHPELEKYFSDAVAEPLFVKNLENVQGDERDVILFSIGYAPDENDQFIMNFGPLNRQGGERRLNVAITRAKEQIVVFASVASSRIDVGRTNSLGAAHLKAFLEYAEKAERCAVSGENLVIGASAASPSPDDADEFVAAVAEFLRSENIPVATAVGCSAYRLDLAVTDPARRNNYALGIETDGAAYNRGLTVRDREETRWNVLRGLGWKMHRVWISEWVHDPAAARERLLTVIKETLQA